LFSQRFGLSILSPSLIHPFFTPCAALDACNDNINDYCSMDDDGNPKYMTLGEKEAKFLEAMAVSFLNDSIPLVMVA
jgi:hypothetical protein